MCYEDCRRQIGGALSYLTRVNGGFWCSSLSLPTTFMDGGQEGVRGNKLDGVSGGGGGGRGLIGPVEEEEEDAG